MGIVRRFFESNNGIFLLKLGSLVRGLNLSSLKYVYNKDRKISEIKSFH
jgi:hypothetical protein